MSQLILPSYQIDLPFDAVSEAELYHPSNGGGFFALLYKSGNGKKFQRSFKIADMAKVLKLADLSKETWISQGEFFRPNRRVVNLSRIGVLFSDIDTYHSDEMKGLSLDAQIQRLHFVCSENRIPPPSLVVFSGRGLQAKWLLDCPVPRAALPRWNACQKALQTALSRLGSDRQARDASRVFRLVDSIHSVSGEQVRVVDVQGPVDAPALYDFDLMADALLQNTREEVAANKAARAEYHEKRKARIQLASDNPKAAIFKGFNSRTLAWHRLDDLRKLKEIRGGWIDADGASSRTLALHWQLNFLCLSGAAHPGNFHYEAAELAREIDPGWRPEDGALTTLRQKARAYAAGESIELNGRCWPALYTPKNQTLIDLFGITDTEQKQLRTIISPDLARDRNTIREREKRRSAGVQERSEYEKQRKQKTAKRVQQIKAMKAEGHSAAAIAKKLGVTTRTVFNALKS